MTHMNATYGELFDQNIDEYSGTVDVYGIEFRASDILKELDPTAYRCCFLDWLDSEEYLYCKGCECAMDVDTDDVVRDYCCDECEENEDEEDEEDDEDE